MLNTAVSRDIQIIITMRDLLAPVGKAIIENVQWINDVEGTEKCKPFHCAGGLQILTANLENNMEVLSNLKSELPYDLPLPPLRVYVQKTRIWKDISTEVCTVAPFTRAKTCRHTNV